MKNLKWITAKSKFKNVQIIESNYNQYKLTVINDIENSSCCYLKYNNLIVFNKKFKNKHINYGKKALENQLFKDIYNRSKIAA